MSENNTLNNNFLPFGARVFMSVINVILLLINFLLGIHLLVSLLDNSLDTLIYKNLYYKTYIIVSGFIGLFIILSMAAFLVTIKKDKGENYLYEGFMITNIVIFNLSFLIVGIISLHIDFTNKNYLI
jgi:hypothetical protein